LSGVSLWLGLRDGSIFQIGDLRIFLQKYCKSYYEYGISIAKNTNIPKILKEMILIF